MAVTTTLALVAVPYALALLARLSAEALRRFWAWWPPTGLEAMPLVVAGLVMVVTAYALATRGSRMRNPALPRRRRFLPPLDLLLLQLGNVTFMSFALIFTVITLGLVSTALRALVARPWPVTYGLAASLAAAGVTALPVLRRLGAAGSQPTTAQRWARRAAILGVATGLLWLFGGGPEHGPLQVRFAAWPADPALLAGVFALPWILLAGVAILGRIGPPAAASGESSRSRRRPTAVSLLLWLAYLGLLTLYLDGVLLTLRERLAAS